MYNPYQRTSLSLSYSTSKANICSAPGLYGRPPDFGSYPGAPPGMGEFMTFIVDPSPVQC